MSDVNFFIKTRDEILGRIEVAEELKTLNDKLKQFNWMFIHPQLFMSEYGRLLKIIENTNSSQEDVTKVFADLFYDFRVTALLVDGFFKKNPFINPFCFNIDQAVMLAITYDYAGAIHLLIPAIEGAMRKYLIDVKGRRNDQIMKAEHLLKVFYFLEEDYIYRKSLEYKPELENRIIDQSKYTRLIDLERKYIQTWFSMVKDYFHITSLWILQGGPFKIS